MSKKALIGAAAAVVLLATIGCETQAPVSCQIQTSGRGGYFVHLTHTGTKAGCPSDIGDIWAFDFYANNTIIGKPVTFDYPAAPGPVTSGNDPYGRGKLPPDPDSGGLCVIDTLSTMTNIDGVNKYAVTNLTFLGTAEILGAVFKADVTVNTATCSGDTYTAEGMAPIITILFNPVTCLSDDFCQSPDAELNGNLAVKCNLDQWAQDIAPLDNDITGVPSIPGQGVCFLSGPFPSLK